MWWIAFLNIVSISNESSLAKHDPTRQSNAFKYSILSFIVHVKRGPWLFHIELHMDASDDTLRLIATLYMLPVNELQC